MVTFLNITTDVLSYAYQLLFYIMFITFATFLHFACLVEFGICAILASNSEMTDR